MSFLRTLSSLSDRDLLASTQAAAKSERKVSADLLAHIAEVDHRKLYRKEACSSMFTYCTERLGLSEDAAAKRLQVARKVRELPELLDALALGRVHLTGLKLLVPHLNADNCTRLIERAEGKSKRKIEELVAELAPRPDVPARLRKLPAPRPTPVRPPPVSIPAEPALLEQPPRVETRPPRRLVLAPLAPARYKLELTADQALYDKIGKARELLRHRVPSGDLVEVIDRAVTLLVDKLEKERFGLTSSPRKSKAELDQDSRHIPNRVKRAVHDRDGGQCSYIDGRGRRCTAHGMLEYDHIVPFAMGGKSDVDNLRLRCRPHNQLHAEEIFGTSFMELKRLSG